MACEVGITQKQLVLNASHCRAFGWEGGLGEIRLGFFFMDGVIRSE